ncbi:MAG TPA: hypothetical protein VI685_04190 [Candidatus Angelobacter sp.]
MLSSRRLVIPSVARNLLLVLLLCSPAFAAVAHVKVVAQVANSTSGISSMTFTLQATNANDAILFGVGCNATGGTPSAVSLSATGWTFTQLSGITGNATNGFMASFIAIAPNTTSVTATLSWTVSGSNCSGFQNVLADEFSGNDTTGGATTADAHSQATGSSGCSLSVTPANANDGVWFACNDSVTNVTGSYSKGGDDGAGDWTEFTILSGGSGVAQSAGFTSSGTMVILGATIKPAGGTASKTCTIALTGAGPC